MTDSALACAALIAAAVTSSCATAPVHRPIGPPLGDSRVELGIAPNAMFGSTEMGVGGSSWAAVRVHDNVDVLARAYGADIFSYQQSSALFSDALFGGGAGLRGRYELFPSLLVGGELFVEYDQRTGGPIPERLMTIVGGLPVAEEAFPGFWVYTDIQLGLAIPLEQDPRGPFFGFQEIPLGVAWEIVPWLVLVGEGGYALPLQGGYGSVGVAFRL